MDEHLHQGDDGYPHTDTVPEPRRGWVEAFQRMAQNGDDALLDGEMRGSTTWDETEREW